jgi:hypothetical protein
MGRGLEMLGPTEIKFSRRLAPPRGEVFQTNLGHLECSEEERSNIGKGLEGGSGIQFIEILPRGDNRNRNIYLGDPLVPVMPSPEE